MSRQSNNCYRAGRLYNGYDYDLQVWVLKGIYQYCGHPGSMRCSCYGRLHAGEEVQNITQTAELMAILSPPKGGS